MAHDKDGNLWPLMLSELITAAQEALAEHGDMVVWVEASRHGYDDTEVTTVPVGYPPIVDCSNLSERKHYWPDRGYVKTFIVSGSETG